MDAFYKASRNKYLDQDVPKMPDSITLSNPSDVLIFAQEAMRFNEDLKKAGLSKNVEVIFFLNYLAFPYFLKCYM